MVSSYPSIIALCVSTFVLIPHCHMPIIPRVRIRVGADVWEMILHHPALSYSSPLCCLSASIYGDEASNSSQVTLKLTVFEWCNVSTNARSQLLGLKNTGISGTVTGACVIKSSCACVKPLLTHSPLSLHVVFHFTRTSGVLSFFLGSGKTPLWFRVM